MGGGELWSSKSRRGAAALALIAVVALVVSAAAGASAVRDGVTTAALAASCGSDEFDGAALDDVRWDVLRPATEGLTVGGGKLNLTLRAGDLITGTASAGNVVLQEAPAGGWTATTELNVAAIDVQGEQAGLVLWRSEGTNLNAFGKMMFNQIDAAGAKAVESIWTERSAQQVPTADSRSTLPSPLPTQDVVMRMRYDGVRVTGEYSLDDGGTWTQAGQAVSYRGTLKVGVMAIQGASGNGGVVPFERFDLECAQQVTASAASGAAPFEATFTSTTDGTWDFGDGTTGAGTSVNHTFTEPGTYRVRQTAGHLTGSTVVTVTPPQAGLPQTDEFGGNELDPKWEVLRPRDTGVAISDGHLRLQQAAGDMHGSNNNPASNVLLQSAPQGCAWTATARIDVSGATSTGDQAGLILWRSESPYFNFSKVVYNRRGGNTWWVERSNTNTGIAAGTTNTALPDPPQYIHLRVNVAADGLVQPQRSVDGTQWTDVGASYYVAGNEPLKVGFTFMGANSTRRANFDYFRVESQTPCVPPPACPELSAPEPGFTHIWNGKSLDGWRQAGPGTFALVNDGAEGCRLETHGGLGLLWYELAQYDDFVLRLQFKTEDDTDNSGVFVRFPNPGANANLPITQGHEIQIREGAAGDGEDQKTGSIYNINREDARNANPAGEWNDYEIKFLDGTYTITLNGEVVNTYTPTGAEIRNAGHIGLQNHGDADKVSFRNIRVQHIGEPYQPNLFTTFGITSTNTRANSEINGNPPYSLPAEEMPPSGTRGPASEDTFDEVPLRMPDTTGTVRNFAAFRGQGLPLRAADQRVYSKIHFFGTTADGSGGGNFVLRFADGTQQVVNVAFDDWCNASQTPAEHIAIGPMTQRYRANGGQDGARCSIFHVPADMTPGKTLVSIQLPRNTNNANGTTQAYLIAVTLEEPGGGFRTPDLSGQLQFADDQTAPVSQHVVTPGAPSGNDGWYREPVSVALSAADEPGGSTVQRIQYRLNGGVPQDYANAPVQITNDGAFTFEYRAIDKAGNAEGFKPVPIKVDRTAPATGIRVEPEATRNSTTWDDRPATVTLTARDGSGSGVAATEYHLGDGNWRPYGGTISLGSDGRYVLHARSRDAAGNAETVQVVDIGIDQTAPTSTAQLTSSEPRGGGVHRAPVTVTLGAADAQSGVSALEYRLDGGQWQAYGGPFTVSAVGGHIVEHRARDHADNLENAKEATFAIGTTSQAVVGPEEVPLPAEPFVGLMPVDRVRVGALLRGDLRVRAACVAVGRGTLALTVSRKVARRLGLGRRTTLASRTVRCGDESRVSVSLEPGRRVKRALRRANGRFTATLRLRMSGADGRAGDSETLTLRG
jgi:PKD repeat protein